MEYLSIILISTFFISLMLALLSLNSKITSMEIVNIMGIGWNLGNAFELYYDLEKISQDEQMISLNNSKISKDMIKSIKKTGFKTIRFPVTWMYYMDDYGNINPKWMSIIKKLVNWIINSNMYCILNVHHDGAFGNWLSEGISAKDKYIHLWNQIATEFQFFDEYLIFESMNDVNYTKDYYDYDTLVTMNQAFVDTIRNSGGYNQKRLLIIAGAKADLDLTCSSDYKMPIDPINKLAISIHYYQPTQFTVEPEDNLWIWEDEYGKHEIQSMTTWGIESHYNDMISNFETMKKAFVDKGIPVILDEISVLTEQKKEIESIREYLYAVYSMADNYDGMMPCLWDTSNKKTGEFNYFDRDNNQWYDEIIKNNFKKISKGKYVKPKEYFIISNQKTVRSSDPDGNFRINIGHKKVLKVIFNVHIINAELYDVGFGIASTDRYGNWVAESLIGTRGKRQYDGSYTFTSDISQKDYNNYIELQKWWGNNFINIHYFTVEFEENEASLDYISYKKALLY